MKGQVVLAVASLTALAVALFAGEEGPCEKCRQAAQQELAKCIEAAISQQDKKSCTEKHDLRMKTCEDGVCKSTTGK